MVTDMYDCLCLYLDRGWAVVPVCAGEKRPTLKGWPDREFDIFDVDPVGNVGVKLGRRSGHLIDVDLDCVEALGLADMYLPQTRAVFGRAAKPYSHRLYVAEGAVFEKICAGSAAARPRPMATGLRVSHRIHSPKVYRFISIYQYLMNSCCEMLRRRFDLQQM
jgi:hypothetical protein